MNVSAKWIEVSFPILCLAALAAGACRHAPKPAMKGQSSVVFVDPPTRPPEPGGPTIEPARRSQWREATLKEPVVMPVYPQNALLAKAGRNIVGVRIIVDPEGRVRETRLSLLVFSTPGPFAEDFRAAVEAALRQWQFVPARAEYFEIVHDGQATYNRVTGSENVETEFDLAFTFTAAGKVEMGK
jgi:hypothetical protein